MLPGIGIARRAVYHSRSGQRETTSRTDVRKLLDRTERVYYHRVRTAEHRFAYGLSRRPVVTIALLPRRTRALGRFVRFSPAAREATSQRTASSASAVNAGRWANLPGEYAGPRARPLDRALPAITMPGLTASVACTGHGLVILHLAGIWTGHVAFEGSADGLTWSRLTLATLDGGPETAATDYPGLWRTLPEQPVAFIRLRVTSLSSGTILAAFAATPAMYRMAHEALDSAA